MASVSAEEAPRLRPYFTLARELGSFAGQLTQTALKAVHIEFQGHVAGLNTRPLTAIVLEGLLRPLIDNVNMINAPVVAKQRGIEVRETRDEGTGNYQTMIRVEVTTETQVRDVAGTLFADSRPRIVQVKGINLEAELAPHMLYITNEDKPGLIGALGTLLGDSGVNVATFHLGRAQPGGDAIALIGVDQAIDDAVLTAVRALPHVAQAQALNF
jgi:D-3-phosphoglycerate dehydrogenase